MYVRNVHDPRWADFARTVKPIVGRIAGPPKDRVPVYHLSSKE